MNKNSTYQTLKKKKRDALQGAPGHTEAEIAAEETQSAKASDTQNPADISADREAAQAPMVESLIQGLGSVFGSESVEKWRELLKASSADAQAGFYRILREQFPELPEDYSLADLAKIAAMKPAKTAKNHPVASAATVAAGIGAFFLVREYLAGNVNSESLGNLGKRAKDMVSSAVAAVPLKASGSTKKKPSNKSKPQTKSAKKSAPSKSKKKSRKSS